MNSQSRPPQRGDTAERGYTIVCVSLRGGGTERVIARAANHLVGQAPVTIVTLAAAPIFYSLNHAISVLEPPTAWRKLPRFIKALGLMIYLVGTFRRRPRDRLLVFGEEITGSVALCAWICGCRDISLFNRGTPVRSLRGFSGWLNRLVYPLVDRVVVQTQQAKSYLAGKAPSARTVVWPNPIEIPDSVSPQQDRDRVIAMVGSIGRNKNQQALINAFLSTSAPEAGWQLWLIGDGPQRETLEANIIQLNACNHVRFLGERTDVNQILREVSIFAFTSRSEGFPNALAEAQAAGCACIAYDCPTGPSELIDDGISGRLIDLDDVVGFSTALDQMVRDIGLRERLAEGGREAIRHRDHHRALKAFDALMQAP